METMVVSLKEMTLEQQAMAGGKGGKLAFMLQKGYPVPDGLVVLPAAFEQEELNEEAWAEVQAGVEAIRAKHPGTSFAIRSSARSEDSAQASFAGEFETLLNVKTDNELREAIRTVRRSRHSERVQAYSTAQKLGAADQLAVVIQRMVPSELAGVLFTADPITGSSVAMTGNYVYGLGERLVSGEANAHPFTLTRPKGSYEGPADFTRFAAKLYRYALRLEEELGGPQDMEWAVAGGRLYLLQTRPITTLRAGSSDTYEWNDSAAGDFLWSNTNVGEAMSGVFTPLSWSFLRMLDEEQTVIPGYYLFSGNLYGRMYTNISLGLSVYPAVGKDIKPLVTRMSEVFGLMPEDAVIPVFPFTKWGLAKAMVPRLITRLKKMKQASGLMSRHLDSSPSWCRTLTARISRAKTKEALIKLWNEELLPGNLTALWVALTGGRRMVIAHKLSQALIRLAGTEDANTLMSNLRGGAALESLGPVIGIAKVMRGDMSRDEYRLKYGHRGPHEFELSIAHPGEDPEWLERQIEDFRQAGTDVEGLLAKQKAQYEAALRRLETKVPSGKAGRLSERLNRVGEAARLRESVRSEWTRVFRVNRAFALQAGRLTGIGEDVFFLYLEEVLRLLQGDASMLPLVPVRKATFRRYEALPPLPSLIRGKFDAFRWAEAPNRRLDYYDATAPVAGIDGEGDAEALLQGFAGAAGRVEGFVRVLGTPEEGTELRPGEILVASTTNVGWTPLFPRAGAVVTDIGAPLSHAAIVARELGIPAVVGCGNATARLKTGDRVLVDGGQGVVKILK
ncbi:PEP-utilizing enzyme [Paenibacillus filicis]|uniref:PEP-utilizing enzyme n=1 Tax=Paenibacillus gyeongsangnamensis TaxID=3388067 RepID=A0ABT4QCF3_9BACL|nr:PEP/pyruvate-binding domain-containing protein [Paenibacillus filicis]MCZ8514447.1 PEP-utilizing enzyme [Paenibacillus filicis]